MNVRETITSKLSSLPTLPAVTHRLLTAARNPDADIKEFVTIIELDPALTANVLKAANSAFIGLRTKVVSITDAMFTLGTTQIFQMAVASLANSHLKRPASGYDLTAEDLWRHSIAVGMMSATLCELLKIKDAGIMYTAGLLHDIGKIAMGEFVSESLCDILAKVDEKNMTFDEAEREILGVDHAEIGSLIAEKWNLPSTIIEPIRWHHSPNKAPQPNPAVDIVHVADAICIMQGIGVGRDGLKYRPSEEAMDRLNITNTIIEKAIIKLLDDLEAVGQLSNHTVTKSEVVRR